MRWADLFDQGRPLRLLVIPFMVSLVTSCSEERLGGPDLSKPAGLPEGVTFAGGVDGGDWVSCDPRADHSVVCTQYDQSGAPSRELALVFCPGLVATTVTNGQMTARAITGPVFFDGVSAFRVRPDRILSSVDEQKTLLAEKEFLSFGVTKNCEPSSDESLLRYVEN